jgi:hypothetical protein
MFNKLIYESLGTNSHERFVYLKRIWHMCNNNEHPKKGEEGFDPAYKMQLPMKVLIENVTALTKKTCDDQCIDEMSFSFGGFGPGGTGLIDNIQGKVGCLRGGQIVLSSDVDHIRPRAALFFRHNCHEKLLAYKGPNEVRHLLNQLEKNPKVDWPSVHYTSDNFFSSPGIFDYVAKRKIACTSTTRRDRLPLTGANAKYLHKEKTKTDERSKAARFFQPILCLREDEGSVQCHVSFQSTSSCNIMCVNSVNRCSTYAAARERGRGENKRNWYVEDNDARELYLLTYGIIDLIDKLIRACNIYVLSWKYWHAGADFQTCLTLVVAHDIYLEVCEGNLRAEYRDPNLVDFWEFRCVLAQQALTYNPHNNLYVGDDQMYVNKKLPTKNRRIIPFSGIPRPTMKKKKMAGFLHATDFLQDRCCGDLGKLIQHLDSVKTQDHCSTRICAWCGQGCTRYCAKCKVWLHLVGVPKGSTKTKTACFFYYHSDNCLGLGKNNFKMLLDENGKVKTK